MRNKISKDDEVDIVSQGSESCHFDCWKEVSATIPEKTSRLVTSSIVPTPQAMPLVPYTMHCILL